MYEKTAKKVKKVNSGSNPEKQFRLGQQALDSELLPFRDGNQYR
jgi:hypothetical protein